VTERGMGDPFGAFDCRKCGAITIRPMLRWDAEEDVIVIFCGDCRYSEVRPTADAIDAGG
jgi:hypothetical protein